MKIDNRVKEIRTKKGLPQAELARTVGVSQKTISLIENGKSLPTFDHAIDIAKALDEKTGDVFFWDKK